MTLPAISEAKLSKYEAGQRACVEELVRTRNGTKSRLDDVAATELQSGVNTDHSCQPKLMDSAISPTFHAG
jgi:hypothetical protein